MKSLKIITIVVFCIVLSAVFTYTCIIPFALEDKTPLSSTSDLNESDEAEEIEQDEQIEIETESGEPSDTEPSSEADDASKTENSVENEETEEIVETEEPATEESFVTVEPAVEEEPIATQKSVVTVELSVTEDTVVTDEPVASEESTVTEEAIKKYPESSGEFYFGWFGVVVEGNVKAAIPNIIMRFHGTLDAVDPTDFTDIILTRDGNVIENNISFNGNVDCYEWDYEDITDFYFSFENEMRTPGNYGMTGKYKGIDFTVYNKILEAPFTENIPANPDDMYSVGWGFYPDVNGMPKEVSEIVFNFKGVQQIFDVSDLSELILLFNGNEIDFSFNKRVFRYLESGWNGEASTSFNLILDDSMTAPGTYTFSGTYRGATFVSDSILIP